MAGRILWSAERDWTPGDAVPWPLALARWLFRQGREFDRSAFPRRLPGRI